MGLTGIVITLSREIRGQLEELLFNQGWDKSITSAFVYAGITLSTVRLDGYPSHSRNNPSD
jgi:hypothetical protein